MAKKVVVVTGGGGIGGACARRMGSGAKLVLADFDGAKLAQVAAAMTAEGYDVTPVQLDVSNAASVAGLAEQAAALGVVKTVIHTAGLSPGQAPHERIYNVNLLGTALMIEAFEKVANPDMAMVCIASIARFAAYPSPQFSGMFARATIADLPGLMAEELTKEPWNNSFAAYFFSKAANFDRVRAATVAYGLKGARINSISPGNISTPMLLSEVSDAIRTMIRLTPMGGLGRPEDIAMAAEFLCGPQAVYITGSDLVVDGGIMPAMEYGGENPFPSVS